MKKWRSGVDLGEGVLSREGVVVGGFGNEPCVSRDS